ncbi:unnamed protein product [Clonostachys solani]|uniref:Heterokaryon incompatibility domain-containing protein n=1 Tax=Clonostachys solani TaxID=160281 RepID=A0A9P0EPL0_9HYPO|nr:unnamed protein product [Clonostachys solani]
MRLINVETLQLETFIVDIPPFAILSHTWGPDGEEISFQDIQDIQNESLEKQCKGMEKLRGCCNQAKEDNLKYAWIDTCCINKESDKELTEAINSMFQWYQQASLCYAFLSDVPSNDDYWDEGSTFFSSSWFQRGWTLQELLAPTELEFYDQNWVLIGTKMDMSAPIEKITGISHRYLLGWEDFRQASVAQRMSWASKRKTSKRKTSRREDGAYCLLGIFDVTMPMIYGERDKAIIRLQEEILKTTGDHSILAWGLATEDKESERPKSIGILATTLSDFANCGGIVPIEHQSSGFHQFDISSGRLRVRLPLHNTPDGKTYALLDCSLEQDVDRSMVGTPVQRSSSAAPKEYVRLQECHSVLLPRVSFTSSTRYVYIQTDRQATVNDATQRRLWLHVDGHRQLQLNLEEAYPPLLWEKGRALILEESTEAKQDIRRHYCIRFRTRECRQQDVIVIIDFQIKETELQRPCYFHVMILSREITLKELSQGFCKLRKCVLGKHTASVGSLNLQLSVDEENVAKEPVFVLRLAQGLFSSVRTVNANLELGFLSPQPGLISLLQKGDRASQKERELEELRSKRDQRLHGMKERLKVVEAELAKLAEEKRLLSVNVEESTNEISSLIQRLSTAKQCREECLEQESEIRRHLDEIEIQNGPGSWLEAIIMMQLKAGGLGYHPGTTSDSGSHTVEKRMNYCTPLLWAAMSGHEVITKLLVENGAEIDSTDSDGNTPLWWATSRSHDGVIRLLLDKGANSRARKKNAQAVYSNATMREEESNVGRLATFDANSTTVKSALGELREIAKAGGDRNQVATMVPGTRVPRSQELAQSLIRIIENENNHGRMHGEIDQALFFAASTGSKYTIQLLLDKGAGLEKRNGMGNTPLISAVEAGHEHTVRLLLENGADVEGRGYRLTTPLSVAVRAGHRSIVELLIERGAHLDAGGSSGALLEEAVRSGDTAILRILLEKGTTYKNEDSVIDPLLRFAACAGRMSMMELLFEKGAKYETTDPNGNKPLGLAAERGHEAIVRLLLEKGADTESKGPDSNTPMGIATLRGCVTVVKALLENGANPEAKNSQGITPLMSAASNGHIETTKLLLKSGVKLETRGSDGRTALLHAACHGSLGVAKMLLDMGADLEARDLWKNTPLGVAVYSGHYDLATLFINRRANLEAKNIKYNTPLLLAAMYRQQSIATLLVQRGADIESKNIDGNTPLLISVFNSDLKIVDSLLEKGANLEARDKEYNTPLLLAVSEKHLKTGRLLIDKCSKSDNLQRMKKQTPAPDTQMARLLLDKGANLEAKDKNGRTPLLSAVSGARVDLINLLLAKGANIEAKNRCGDTSLFLAVCKRDKIITKLLLQGDADPKAQNNGGNTPLNYAREDGDVVIVELLSQKIATERSVVGIFEKMFQRKAFKSK